VASVGSVRSDEAKAIKLRGRDIALCFVDGEYYAIGNVCTHQHALLSDGFIENGCIECPLHQGRFDVRTGRALGPPVADPLPIYPVRVYDGKILVFLP
jgi:nitrite reductase/ring-hydroxylating ferredoxin subunit